jgi:hypothetical protein
MKSRRRWPSPALIVSIVALVLALTGSAIAGQATISALTGSDKKKVKKIADKRITARAPNLSVKGAETANTANGVAGEFFAVVNPDGTLARGRGSVSSRRANLGQYYVAIGRDPNPCFFVATLGGTPTADTSGQIAALMDPGATNEVFVVTRDTAGATADRTFSLYVRC